MAVEKLREIEWHPKTNKLSQISKEGLEFALVSNDYKQIHQLVWCKDFLQDVYHGHVNNSVSKIYGFKYNPSEDHCVPDNRILMIISNWKDKELGDRIKKRCLPLLHEVEGKLRMSKSKVEKCGNVPLRYKRSGIWLFNSSKRWFKAPPMISFYCLLIRIGLVREEDDDFEKTIEKLKSGEINSYFSSEKEQDKYQIRRAEDGIRRILKHGDRKIFYTNIKLNYPPIGQKAKHGNGLVNMYTIHEYSGIVAYSENTTKLFFPHWHRFDESTLKVKV